MEPVPPPNPPAANISKRVMEARGSDNEGEGLDAVRQTVHIKTKEVPKKKRASGTGSYDADAMSTKVLYDFVATGDGVTIACGSLGLVKSTLRGVNGGGSAGERYRWEFATVERENSKCEV